VGLGKSILKNINEYMITSNILQIFLWGWLFIWFVLIFVFIVKELYRYFITDPKIKNDGSITDEIRRNKLEENKKNLNVLLGLDKKTLLSLAVNMVIVSLAFLSFIYAGIQNKETALINEKSLEISQSSLEIIRNINKPQE